MYDESSCNLTAYSEWYSSPLERHTTSHLILDSVRVDIHQILRSDKAAWRIMNFDTEHEKFLALYDGRRPKPLNITKGQAMGLSTVWCTEVLMDVRLGVAGGHGPPSDLAIHDAMCGSYCLASDALRGQALASSQCNCLELPLQDDDFQFKKRETGVRQTR